MIIWRGWGFVVVIIVAVVHLILAFVLEQTLGIPDSALKAYRDEHAWLWFVSLGACSVACWYAGTALERRELKNAKVVTDKETGQDVRLIGCHDLFWIPVKWWSVIWIVAGVWLAVSGK